MRAVYGDADSDACTTVCLNLSGNPIGSDGECLIDNETVVGQLWISIGRPDDAQITDSSYTSR